MRSFAAILKLTVRTILRSHIFVLLVLILVLLVGAIPFTVVDDGTPEGHIRVSLEYCLGAVTFILTISTIWVGCFVAAGDIENHHIHMLAVKPVSRIKIWMAKFSGVFLVHFILLLVSGLAIYISVMSEYRRKPYTEEQRRKIESEILVGRRVYMPLAPDFEAAVRKEYQQREKAKKELGLRPEKPVEGPGDLIGAEAISDYTLRKNVKEKLGEVPYGPSGIRYWEYRGVRKTSGNPMFVRFRLYVDRPDKKDQRRTVGQWIVRIRPSPEMVRQMIDEAPVKATRTPESILVSLKPYPEAFTGGVFSEFLLPAEAIQDDGSVTLGYGNMDPKKTPVFFQMADGPKLLVRITGFLENFIRGLMVISIKLAFLAALSCALGGIFSMPVSVFLCAGYILLGVFSSYLLALEESYEQGIPQKLSFSSLESIHDYIGKRVSRAVLATTVPVENLGVSDSISDGELIEYRRIAKIFLAYFLVKGVPLFALCIWFYRKRELGAVTRR